MNVQEAATIQVRYAGFWRRLAAYLIDAIILGIISWILRPMGIVGIVLSSITSIFYFIGFWAGLGQTPGKAALGIKVVRIDRTNIGGGTAILRYIGYIISSIIVCIGFIMIAFHGKKQGLHDLIAGTIVIIERSPIQEAHSKAEFESSLARMDTIQTERHGL